MAALRARSSLGKNALYTWLAAFFLLQQHKVFLGVSLYLNRVEHAKRGDAGTDGEG